jgi:hypothetical protein
MWVIYSLAVRTVLQAFVSTFLVDRGLEKQISTVDDIMHSGFRKEMPKTHEGLLYNLPKTQSGVMLSRTVMGAKVTDCAKRWQKKGILSPFCRMSQLII